ncbi:MAG TPA: DUF5681 domain-containing protein [Syntrophobacteraceae bacterium]|nr:DUF5681 domain-containing protein [Syntrophobacteraceae bacterium]
MSPESSLNLQDGRFKKGRSGNPAGKPQGARNRSTAIAQSLLDGEAEALVRKVVELALEGDPVCLRICLERLVAPKKDAPVRIDIPEIGAVADLPKLISAVTQALSQGLITPMQARALTDLAEDVLKVLEAAEIERRVTALEEKAGLRG